MRNLLLIDILFHHFSYRNAETADRSMNYILKLKKCYLPVS